MVSTYVRGISVRLLSRMRAGLILVPMLVAWPSVHAGELSLLINGKAFHYNVPAGADYNEENWGAGLHYEFGDTKADWVRFAHASEFKDSNYNVSYYFGGGVLRRFALSGEDTKFHLDVGVIGFLMHRDQFRNGDLFPGALPFVSLGTERFALNVTYVPKVDPKMSPLFFLQLKVVLPWFQ